MTQDKPVDLDLLRQVTTDSIRVYEAIHRAQTLTAEGAHILALAEDLLHKTGLAYLTEDITAAPISSEVASSELEKMVSAYVQIQQGYIDLKDALCRLAKAQIKAKKWKAAANLSGALLELEPENHEVVSLAKKVRDDWLEESTVHFDHGKWKMGRAALEEMQIAFPKDNQIRIEHITSFVLEAEAMSGQAKSNLPLSELSRQEPDVAKWQAFERAWSAAWSHDNAWIDLWSGHSGVEMDHHEFWHSLEDLKKEINSRIGDRKRKGKSHISTLNQE